MSQIIHCSQGFLSPRVSFSLHRTATTTTPSWKAHDNNNNDNMDFDPLLSPHCYPQGTDAGPERTIEKQQQQHPTTPSLLDTIDKKAAVQQKSYIQTSSSSIEHDDDIKDTRQPMGFHHQDDFFDPLLSPHAYPHGTEAGPVVNENENRVKPPTRKKKTFGITLPTSDEPITREEEAPPTTRSIDPDTFDPTLSPHAYGGKKKGVVGILLIDHGSKNPAANERLVEIAHQYRTRYGNEMMVQIAHMELAEPSIAQGLAALSQQEQVTEIVCQPYFLSPGRHVQEDIPRLVEQAIQELELSMPCRVIPHVGSRTEGMVDAIHSIVVSETTTTVSNNNSV